MRRFLLVPCCLAALLPFGQQPQQPQPTFQARVDVVAVDVHVVDSSGRPVSDLRPEEFAVTVDGKPRSIVAADYISYPSANVTPAAAATQERPRPLFTTNRSLPASRPGRWILLVVDEENVRAGYARHAATAAARFLDQVQPNDRVGLLTLGTGATHIDPTTDRAVVRVALGRIAGHLVPVETMLDFVYLSLPKILNVLAPLQI
jgi:VWFA-related protein